MTTPSKRTPNRRTTAPKTKVSLDLDKLESEGKFEEVGPFTFRHGGKVFTLGSPDDIDLFDIVEFGASAAGNAVIFSRMLGDQYDDLRAIGPMPARKVNAVMEAWQEHYGVNQGESPASVATSNGTEAR
jgi:hypothetical protein